MWGMAHDGVYRYETPWPRLIRERIRDEFCINTVVDGLCSRTSIHDDPNQTDWMDSAKPYYFNGLKHLGVVLQSHSPRFLVILLGTNDLKQHILESTGDYTAKGIAQNVLKLVIEARRHAGVHACHRVLSSNILVISPPRIVFNDESAALGYSLESERISLELGDAFECECAKHNVAHLSLTDAIDMNDSVDGVHWTLEHNRIVADLIWKKLAVLFRKDRAVRELRRLSS